MPTLKSKGIVSVFRARINRFDEDFGFLSEGIFLAYCLFTLYLSFERRKGYMDPHMGRAAPRLKDEGTALFACKRSVGCSEETGADLNPFLGVALLLPSGARRAASP